MSSYEMYLDLEVDIVHLKFFFVYAATLVAFSQMFYFLLVRDQEYADEGGNGIFDMPWTAFLKVITFH